MSASPARTIWCWLCFGARCAWRPTISRRRRRRWPIRCGGWKRGGAGGGWGGPVRGPSRGLVREGPNRRGAAMSRERLRLAEARPAELQAALEPLLDLIARELAAGMDAGCVRAAEPARLAALVYNLVSTTAHAE